MTVFAERPNREMFLFHYLFPDCARLVTVWWTLIEEPSFPERKQTAKQERPKDDTDRKLSFMM
jgi:hypothetical protein